MTECMPVGWTTPCPSGFTAAPDGWGCIELVPPTACAGATREDVLTGACVPIGDCSAPFPPAAATLFVDANYTSAMLDATHFNAIQDAVNAAASGATVAIAQGVYVESVGVIDKSLTLAGACAAGVVIQYGSGETSGIYSNQTLNVSGVTVTGFPGGILVQGGALDLEDSLITSNVSVGLYVQGSSKASVLRSKVTGTTFPAGESQLGGGVAVLQGSTLDIQDSAVVDNVYANFLVKNPMSVITAERVVASRNTLVDASVPANASVLADDSGQVAFTQGVIAGAAQFGAAATNGATVTISESVVRSATGTLANKGGIGVFSGMGGAVTVQSSLLAAHPVVGAYVGAGGTLSLESVLVRGPENRAPRRVRPRRAVDGGHAYGEK